MSEHHYPKTVYTVAEISDTVEWTNCYSAAALQQELQQHFVGKKILNAYVELEGYLDSDHHRFNLINLSYVGGGCLIVLENAVLELGIHAEGLFCYRILPPECVKMHTVCDHPPDDFNTMCDCYFDMDDHDITVAIAGQTVSDMIVEATDQWSFDLERFDTERLRESADKRDLPLAIDLCTDLYTLRIVGDDMEYFWVSIDPKGVSEEPDAPDTDDWRFGVVGNIVIRHLDDEGIVRYGTKSFPGGAKVYLCGKGWDQTAETIAVLGRNRHGRYTTASVPVSLVDCVRTQRIFKPGVLKKMSHLEYCEGWHWWKRTASDRNETEAFAESWNENHALNEDGEWQTMY